MVNLTLEKPPTTLGENQFESSSLFLENAFYRENFQQINFSKNRNFQQAKLICFQPKRQSEKCCKSCTDRTDVRTVRMYGSTDRTDCTDCTDGRTDLYGQPSEKVQKIVSSILVLKNNFFHYFAHKNCLFLLVLYAVRIC